jgi:hypothetical protein
VNKWHGNLDNKLWTYHCLGFIVETKISIVKKKRTLPFYTLHTLVYDKKGSPYGGWVGIGQLLIAARQTVYQCINNSVSVIKLFKMPDFTSVELTDMVLAYGAVQAKILYREQFPDRVIPNSKTFTSTVQRLRETGKFHSRRDRGRNRPQRVLDDEPQILEVVEANSEISTRRIALQVGISHHAVWHTLKEHGLYCYDVQKVQALQLGDEVRRQ